MNTERTKDQGASDKSQRAVAQEGLGIWFEGGATRPCGDCATLSLQGRVAPPSMSVFQPGALRGYFLVLGPRSLALSTHAEERGFHWRENA